MTAECKAWLDKKPPHSVVYVAFGSIAAPSLHQLAEMAEGLYNSGKAFLWVLRGSETSKIPESFVGKVKERGLIVAWSPQLEVLAHHAIGCFVTHCGWNSTMEGLGIGVPMVAMPQWSDQPMNAKYIQDVWRVGVRARPDAEGVVRKDEVERCVREVMEGEKSNGLRKNAMSWREKAKRAMGEGGSSDRNIMEFLAKFGRAPSPVAPTARRPSAHRRHLPQSRAISHHPNYLPPHLHIATNHSPPYYDIHEPPPITPSTRRCTQRWHDKLPGQAAGSDNV
ncbi:hypothetical protein U9M48_008807 [Paspalum notatum var. saurae]|uniref:UDP-glycosyltransferases domain-containing protein n=1 Tax=Paspalum notatum var. saurae TaxID=547442 RepID=A0AAQ3WE87_PASNO